MPNNVFAKLSGCQYEALNRKLHVFAFVFLLLQENRKTPKRKWKKAPKPIKTVLLGCYPKNEKMKKWIFGKNYRLPDTICARKGEKRAFSCTPSVLAKIFFWAQTVKTRKNYKNSGFSGNCPKPKMTPSCFLALVKKWFLLTVFWKSCAFLRTPFYSAFCKTQQLQ